MDLKKGLKIALVSGLLANVESTFAFDTAATVYNFEVEKTHNYYVGTEGVLVHNECIVNSSTGKIIGTLKGIENGIGEIEYIMKDLEFFPGKEVDLESYANFANKANILPNEKILYMDFNIPKEIRDALKNNEEYLGKVSLGKAMFDDAFEKYTKKAGKDLDGIYGEWIVSSNYPNGLSFNLEKYRQGLLETLDKTKYATIEEQAAFKTITGKWAASKGYTKAQIVRSSADRVEVIFRK